MLHPLDDVGARLEGGRVRSPFLDEMEALSAAAWRTFPASGAGETTTCPCCLPEGVRARLATLRREDWTADDLESFASSAHGYGGASANRMRYLLPRFLEIVLRREKPEDSLHDHPLNHVVGNRAHGDWTQTELDILDGFVSAWCAHAAVCELAYDMLPEGTIHEGDFDEDLTSNALEAVVNTGGDAVAVLRRTLDEAGHAGAYGAAQTLVRSRTELARRGTLDWDPLWGDPAREEPARLLAALTDEAAGAAMDRLRLAVPDGEVGWRIEQVAVEALSLAANVRAGRA